MGLLVLATVMMPITYRAGTDISHSHTIFQAMIDAVAGQTHSHGNAGSQPGVAAPSPFSPAAVPLTAGHGAGFQTPTSEIDVANVLASAPAPVSHASAIHMLGVLVASLLLASYASSRHWPQVRSLVSIVGPVDVPPPRPVA